MATTRHVSASRAGAASVVVQETTGKTFMVAGVGALRESAGGAWSLVAHAGSTFASTASSDTTATPIDTTGADLLVVVGSRYSGVAAGTVSDSKGNTWTAFPQQVNGVEAMQAFYVHAPAVGPGHTFAFSGQFSSCAVAAFSGSGTSPLDVYGVGTTGGATSMPSASSPITPGQNNSLIVTCLGVGTPGVSITVDAPFIITDAIPSQVPNYEGCGIAYIVQATAAAVNPWWYWSGGAIAAGATIAAFKPAGAPPPPAGQQILFRGVF